MKGDEIDRAKQSAREKVWTLLERERAAPLGVHGHIPKFEGADQAAGRLAALNVWQAARVLKTNPDKAQLPVRVRALHDGKLLYMAVPRLATPKPFYLLDPAALTVPFARAATSDGASSASPTIGVDQMRRDELIECGPPRRPNGIVLRLLTEEKIAAIPVLAGLSSSLTQRR